MFMKFLDVELVFFETELVESISGVLNGLLVSSAFDFLLDVLEEKWSILLDASTQDFLTDVCLEGRDDTID